MISIEPHSRIRAALIVVAVLYGIVLLRYESHAAGGSDSSGYLNLAKSIVSWQPVQPIPELAALGLSADFWQSFVPLGYVPGPRPATIAPIYPPGFPVQLAIAGTLFGWNQGPFWVAPLSGVLCLLVLFAFARDLGLNPSSAFAGVLILAAYPDFLFQALQPMSDVPATLWTLLTLFCAHRSRKDPRFAALSGLTFGVNALIRPTTILLLPAILVLLGLRPKRLVLFGLGGVPAFVFFIAFNLTAFHRPFMTGYGEIGLATALAWKNFPPRLRHYSHWLSTTLTGFVLFGWLTGLLDRKILVRTRIALALWFLSFFVFYCCYEVYQSWTFLRFLLPVVPALILGFLLWGQHMFQLIDRRPESSEYARPLVLAAVLIVLAFEIRQVHKLHVFLNLSGESRYPSGCRLAESVAPRNAIVVSMAFSGALRYYTHLSAFRWNGVDPSKAPEIFAAFARSRRPIYALLFEIEEEDLRRYLPAPWRQIRTDGPVRLWALPPANTPEEPTLDRAP